jgi:hypothetical protein
MLQLAAAALAFIELGTLLGQEFRQARVEQLLAQVCEVRLQVDWPQVLGQSRSGRPEVGRTHDFKVLLVLRGGSTGQLVNPLTHMLGIFYRKKVIEGCEKVVVPRLLGGGNKRPHGKYVDQLVVEVLVGECVGGALALFPTNWLRGQTACCGRCLVKRERLGVDTEIVFHRLADEAFSVHRSRQVSVQIGSLGHVVQEGVEGKRSLPASLLESSSGAGFAILRYGLGLSDGGRGQAEQQSGGGGMEGPANWSTASGHRSRRQPVYSDCELRPRFPVRGSIHGCVCGFH